MSGTATEEVQEQLSESVERLAVHLLQLCEQPTTISLRPALADTLAAQLSIAPPSETYAYTLAAKFIPIIQQVLPVIQQDPQPITSLLEKILQNFPFQRALQLADSATFLSLLQAPVPANNLLALSLLEKAAKSDGDIAIIATWNTVCKELVKLMLTCDDMGVHSKAEQVLISFLKTDHQAPESSDIRLKTQTEKGGSGLLWRRIFSDRDIYETILSSCSSKGRTDRTVTRAQGRLLEFLPQIAALEWSVVTAHPFPDLIAEYSNPGTSASGLLDFATIGMINDQSDILMWMLHVDYYTKLIDGLAPSEKILSYLSHPNISKHQEAVTLYLRPHIFTTDSMEQHLLEERAAAYVAKYAQLFPDHLINSKGSVLQISKEVRAEYPGFSDEEYTRFQGAFDLEGTQLIDLILLRIGHNLDTVRELTITYNPPTSSLAVLTSLPPASLLSQPISSRSSPSSISAPILQRWTASNTVLSLVPLSPPRIEYLTTLGTIMHKSSQLYTAYVTEISNREHGVESNIGYTPDQLPPTAVSAWFWSRILSFASAPALTGACLAAHTLILAIAESTQWEGYVEVLKQNSIMEMLLRPPQRHGGRGVPDSESIEYKLAIVKLDIVIVLARRMIACGLNQEGEVADEARWLGNHQAKRELVQRWAKLIIKRSRSGLWDKRVQPAVESMQL